MRSWLQPTSECLQQPDLLISINLLKIDYCVSLILNYLYCSVYKNIVTELKGDQ